MGTKISENHLAFVLAGRATFTLENTATGRRFTYRVRRKDGAGPEDLHFVSVLTGPDNGRSYTYLGCIWGGARYVHGRKSPISTQAFSAAGFAWLWRLLVENRPLPAGVLFHHAGRCARCGRTLTVPNSLRTGFGPVCAVLAGLTWAHLPPPVTWGRDPVEEGHADLDNDPDLGDSAHPGHPTNHESN